MDRTTRKLSPLWIALIVAAILVVIAYAIIFWMPGEAVDGGEVVPVAPTLPQ